MKTPAADCSARVLRTFRSCHSASVLPDESNLGCQHTLQDVRFAFTSGRKVSYPPCQQRATFGLMRRNKKRLQYRPSIINIRDIFGGY